MVSIETMHRALRKYVREEVIDTCLRLMRKVGRAEFELSQREAAELIYLSCGICDKERTRSVLHLDRENSTAFRAVDMIEALLLSPERHNESGIPTNVLRDLSRQYRGQEAPGYVDGRRIQVRGGASLGWTAEPKSYEVQ